MLKQNALNKTYLSENCSVCIIPVTDETFYLHINVFQALCSIWVLHIISM